METTCYSLSYRIQAGLVQPLMLASPRCRLKGARLPMHVCDADRKQL
ncbi:hypothetical protein CES86_0225 [Brucella lupini]|uniref:Uncharacterized protein n=1 Tax=Brucella lupini TaxID=255457 RepID=A0A256H0E0_9HYPH|nr:hypothetical protein CES86_0225 [Brucella lupini]